MPSWILAACLAGAWSVERSVSDAAAMDIDGSRQQQEAEIGLSWPGLAS